VSVRHALGALAFAGLGFLAGCTTLPNDAAPVGDSLSGRMAVRVEATPTAPAQSVSAGFELQGTPRVGRLNLSSPLGTVMAQARWADQRAWLVTPEGETAFDSLDAMTREMLGESLPVAALFDWLRGRPWGGAPSQSAERGFAQLGWAIDLARFDEGWVVAQRAQAPAVTVRARVDQP
jgi:outer membrane lipoprotein LolB